MAEEEFKATPIYIAPIFASLLVSVLCAFLFLESKVELTPTTVFPETGYGPLFNAMIFVLAAGFGATMIYFLLKRGVHRFLRILTTAFVVLEVFLRKGKFHAIIVLIFGGATGALLGASIPLFSAVLILLLLGIYDVVAVFRGPVGKIAAKGLEHLPGASFSFRNIYVGLGDLTFYSMLVSRVFLSFGWEACVAAMFGVLLGSFLSFKMVEKKGMFPGLPFSVLFGLFASFIVLIWN